jgi:hypothetical protein
LDKLIIDTADWIRVRYAPLQHVNQLVDFPKFKSLSAIKLPEDCYAGVRAVLRNIIQNAIETGVLEKNAVTIDDTPFYNVGRRNVLRIFSRVHRFFDPGVLDSLTVRPFVDRQGEVRFGMFLVGIITRMLGGVIHVQRAVDISSAAVHVLIPYPTG